jgi:hypothetical protein
MERDLERILEDLQEIADFCKRNNLPESAEAVLRAQEALMLDLGLISALSPTSSQIRKS